MSTHEIPVSKHIYICGKAYILRCAWALAWWTVC